MVLINQSKNRKGNVTRNDQHSKMKRPIEIKKYMGKKKVAGGEGAKLKCESSVEVENG